MNPALRFARGLCVAVAFALLLGPGVGSALPAGLGDAGATLEHEFIGARKCKKCHGKELMGDQSGIWRKGLHRSAVDTLAKPASLVIARKKGLTALPQEAPECLVCHATAYGVPADKIWKPLDLKEGVQCESCHGPGRDYRKKKVMDDLDEARAKGLWDPDAESGICEHCHNEASPTFDSRRYALPDGSTTGFDYDQALDKIAHPIPEHVKGRYLELRKKEKAEEKAAEEAD